MCFHHSSSITNISINFKSSYSYISVAKVTSRIRVTLEYSILLRYINYIYIHFIYCTFQVSYILVRQSSCLGSLEPASLSCFMFCYTRSRNICFQYFVANIVFSHFITIVYNNRQYGSSYLDICVIYGLQSIQSIHSIFYDF